tara:strand:+ start:2045 stop:2470 length:426 start_codon:yes stop_codon:yes gene_type:complete
MNIDNYPVTEKQIDEWNKHLGKIKVFPMELLLDKSNKNYNNLQKIFITLKVDNIHPSEFLETYVNAKLEENLEHFILKMTKMFMIHKVNKYLSEGQTIKSARTQTVARLLCLNNSDPQYSEEENFKKFKKIVRETTKNIRI